MIEKSNNEDVLTNAKFYEQWQGYASIIDKFAINQGAENIPVNIFKVIETYNEQVEYMKNEITRLQCEVEMFKNGIDGGFKFMRCLQNLN
jgi:hypothetical protein